MTLKNVFIFTSDSKNGKLIELNAGAHSGIDGLNKEYKVSDTIADKVAPYLNNKIETHTVIPITGYGSIRSSYVDRIDETFTFYPSLKDENTLFIRGFSLSGNINSADSMFTKRFPNVTLDNNIPAVCDMYADKSQFFKIISASETKNTPYTKSYSMNSLEESGTADFSNFSHVVIKPIDGFQGDGIIVVKGEDCQKVIQSLANKDFDTVSALTNGNSNPAIQHWKEQPHNNVQIQEFVTGEPFEHKGKKWDTTDRHLWSVIHTQDNNGEDNFEVECHGAFKKLPLTSIDNQNDVSQENSISASGVSMIGKMFNYITKESGSGEKVFIPEGEDINREKLAHDLIQTFKTAITMSDNIAVAEASQAKASLNPKPI